MKASAYAVASLVTLVALAVVAAIFVVQGERLAGIVNGVLPEMKGKIHFKAIHWKARLLYDLVVDRPSPVDIEGLLITDPEGTKVLDVPHLQVAVRLKPLISGGGIFLSDLKVGPQSVWRFAQMSKLKGIGFLAALKPKNPSPPAPPPPAGSKEDDGFVFQIANAQLDGFRAIFDFPGVWGFDLRDIHAPASFIIDKDGFVGWDVVGLEARQGGYLMVMDQVLPFDRVVVNRVATTREWSDDIFLDLSLGKTGQSELRGKGFFTGIYGSNSVSGIKMHAEFNHAADALTAVAKPHNIAGLRLSGDDAHVAGDLVGPYETLDIKAAIGGLDAAYGDYAVKQLTVKAGIAFATKAPTMTIKVDDLSFASPTGGKFSSAITMAGDDVKAKLGFEHFDTESYVPENLRALAAGKLHGRIGIAANLGKDKSVKLSELDLHYDRDSRAGGVPGSVRISGQAQASTENATSAGLHIVIPGARADLHGKVELAKKLLDVGLRVTASDLPSVLASMKLGPLAKSAEVSVDVKGSLDKPDATGSIDVGGIGGGATGIPPVDRFRTAFHLRDGTLHVDSLHAGIAGGSIDGSGEAKLFEKTLAHMLDAPGLDFHLDGKRLSLQDLIGSALVTGHVSFSVQATGTVKQPKIHVQVPAGTTVEVMGQAWNLEGIDIEADKEKLVVRLCHIAGKRGGDIQIEGQIRLDRKPLAIDWRIKIVDLPIASVLAAAKVDVPASGKISVDLHALGPMTSPAVDGTIALSDLRAFGIDLGTSTLALSPSGDGGVNVSGTLFGRLNLQATAAYGPQGPRAQAELSFQNLHVEDLVPDLRENAIAAALSGKISLDLQPGHLPVIDAQLTQIDASITRDVEQDDGRTTSERIWLRNASPLHVTTDTQKVVVEPTRLLTQGGEFSLSAQIHPIKDSSGAAVDQGISADLAGKLDLDLLQPLLASKLTALRGGIGLGVHVGGSVKKPDLNGQIAIVRPVHAEARAFDQVVSIPSGTLQLTSSSIALTDLAVAIDDATLKLGGKVTLGPGFTPESVAVNVEGEANAKLLESLAPSAVSDVSGKASIKATVNGRLEDPEVSARVSLGEIQMRLRGVSRRVEIRSGNLDLTTHELLLRDVLVRLDDDGELWIGAKGMRPGRVHIKRLRPEFEWDSIDLPLRGTRLGYRDGGIEVDDLSLAMDLSGTPGDGLTLGGDVRLVSGRYLQDFNVRNLVLSPSINEKNARPVGEGVPLVQNLALALRVRTEGDGFVVQNNLAPEIHVVIDLGIGGVLSAPTISGEIRPTDGRFHIIGLRGDFELSPNVNHVTFVPTKSLASGDTPELNLEAQNTYPDAAGVEHVVLMKINGPINQATIDLSTTDGMDRNQTMMLLLSGRTTDDLNGNSGQVFGLNRQSGLDMIGQVSRDTVSNLVEPYIDDTLQILTGRKLNLRPTIGADGFELKVQARATREFDLETSYLRGFQSQERYRAQLSWWIYDYLTLRGIGDRLTYSLQQGLPVQTNTAKLELTLEYPLRFPFP